MQMFPPPRAVGVHHPALRTLHWLMAFVIFVALGLGISATQLPRGHLRSDVLFVHKSFGITVLALIVVRVIVRLVVGAPAYVVPLRRLVKAASRSVHILLYTLMIAMPVSGYIMSSAGRHDVSFFGLFTLPNLVPRDKALAEAASWTHFILACTLGTMLAAHLTAVIWHARVKRDTVLTRMWPRFRPVPPVR